jgi:hypothetical protein
MQRVKPEEFQLGSGCNGDLELQASGLNPIATAHTTNLPTAWPCGYEKQPEQVRGQEDERSSASHGSEDRAERRPLWCHTVHRLNNISNWRVDRRRA